jgi:hypothetical protein
MSRQRLRLSRGEVDAIIEEQLTRGQELLAAGASVRDSNALATWEHDLERWHALGRDALATGYDTPEPADEFYEAALGRPFRRVNQNDAETLRYRLEATKAGINTLLSLRERLRFAEEPVLPPATSPAGIAKGTGLPGNTIFIVHGHDEAAKQEVARFLERVVTPKVVILEEQPDLGRTIIEKFEEHAGKVGYAVVLLTADDEGRKRGEEHLRPRARQNVILELGFFVGVLGRPRVALVYEEGVELPSDIQGVLYLLLDHAGGWKTRLAREMRAVGVPIDTDALLSA